MHHVSVAPGFFFFFLLFSERKWVVEEGVARMDVMLEPFPFEGRWAAHETVHLTEVHIVLA